MASRALSVVFLLAYFEPIVNSSFFSGLTVILVARFVYSNNGE